MLQRYLYILIALMTSVSFCGCRDEVLFLNDTGNNTDRLIEFEVEILDSPGTRRDLIEESKKIFETGEIIHIRAEFDCSRNSTPYKEVKYGIMKYSGKGKWTAYDAIHTLYWPNDAVSGTFTAFYMHGSNGEFTSNMMEAKLLSEYKYGEDPLRSDPVTLSYGTTVRLQMYHIFSHLTLSEMSNDVPEELWFTINAGKKTNSDQDDDLDEEEVLNNAFYFDFIYDEENNKLEITPVFTQLASETYTDSEGNRRAYVKGYGETYDTEDGSVMTRVCYFLEPKAYHKFSLLYPRSHTEYSTYLTYTRDLAELTGSQGMVSNGTYDFSVLKSLGVVVEEEPDDNWEDDNLAYEVDVEDFLKAAASGQEYWVDCENGEDEKIQILEPTPTGVRLMKNVDFRYYRYNVFSDGYIPNLSNTFDGNYHYIMNISCPLFYQNQGNITNLGIKNAKTCDPATGQVLPLISNENFPLENGETFDTSYNGFICSRNFGIVRNVRMINADMTVNIRTSDPDEPAQEAHNAAILFGVNRGTASNISLAGDLNITVQNDPGEEIVPNVLLGGIAGQNLGAISGLSAIDGDTYASPVISLINKCKGDNGVYLIGGVCGNNPGTIDDVYMPSVTITATASEGVESRMGGIVGEIPSSNSGAPKISGCIVRGSITAGKVFPKTNVQSMTYAGGVAGSSNIQAFIDNVSVSISVTGSPHTDNSVTYATGGAFGRIEKSEGIGEGDIQKVAAFGSVLTGVSQYIGNFAGIVPKDFGWEHYENNDIAVRQAVEKNIGIEL